MYALTVVNEVAKTGSRGIYPEYVIMIILLALILVGVGAIIFFLMKIYSEMGGELGSSKQNQMPNNMPNYYNGAAQQNPYANAPQQQNPYANQVVYCPKCSTEYDASQWCCPRCGTPR